MVAQKLFEAGQVTEAIQSLSAHLRDHPTDTAERVFLFELLCFAGQYDRAESQLSVLAQGSSDAQMGAILYYSALHAEKTRHDLFSRQAFPVTPEEKSPAGPLSGTLNGKPFSSITDADPEIGMRLEVYAAGSYVCLPFQHLAQLRCEPPRNLRDSLWAPAYVRTAPGSGDKELGEVLIPVVYPFSWKHPDQNIWLGRATDWEEDEQQKRYPFGQKLFIVDGEEVSFLEVRTLEFTSGQTAAM